MTLKLINFWLFLSALFILSGCFSTGNSSGEKSPVVVNNAGEDGEVISLNVTSNAILQQIIPSNRAASQNSASSSKPLFKNEEASLQIYSGTLDIKEGTTPIGTYTVTATLDDSNWEVALQQSFIIIPGNYTFTLLLSDSSTNYAGITTFTVNEGDTNIISMTIVPVIGDTLIDIDIITGLGSFKFHYSDIPNLENFNAKLGIIVDSGSEEYYAIDSATGMTETYLNLTTGEHTIELKLYDGNQQMAKSLSSQETRNISAGQSITMDLVPIYGQSTHSISADGSSANFTITIPQAIIDQVTSSSNLKITYSMNGPATDNILYMDDITQIDYDETTDTYSADISLSEASGSFYPSTLFLHLSFYMITGNEFVGTCSIQTALNSNERSSLCPIPVVNSLIATGSILAAFGIEVCENNGSGECGNLAGGASIYSMDSVNGDELIGMTNSNGLFIANLKGGNYTFRAMNSDGRFGETPPMTIDPMDVEDIEIILSASAPTNPSIVINSGDSFTYSPYVSLTLSAEDLVGITGYYVSEDSTPPSDSSPDDWIVATQNQNFETTIAFELSENIGLKTIFAWFKNVNGHRSERMESTITVQDNNSLYFENFRFTDSPYSSPYDGNGDSHCLSLGETYRMADWNEVATVIDQNSTVDSGDFVSDGGLAPSSGFLCAWLSCSAPTGAFVSYNGNEDAYGEKFAVAVASDTARDIDLGWTSHSEPAIGGSLQLYNIAVDQTATVLCYDDSGAHPLVNGEFSQGRELWDNPMGIAEVINESMVLRTSEEAVTHSMVKQDKIALKSNQNYQVTFKAETSSPTLTAGIYGSGITLNSASYDVYPEDGWETYLPEGYVELVGQNDDASSDLYYNITLGFSTNSTTQQQLMIYFQIPNGTLNETATIDDVTLTEVP